MKKTSGQLVRNHVWRHNSFFGYARMMIAQCRNIIEAESTTPEAKEVAREISRTADQLIKELRRRVDK